MIIKCNHKYVSCQELVGFDDRVAQVKDSIICVTCGHTPKEIDERKRNIHEIDFNKTI